jgi:hypothetical protein
LPIYDQLIRAAKIIVQNTGFLVILLTVELMTEKCHANFRGYAKSRKYSRRRRGYGRPFWHRKAPGKLTLPATGGEIVLKDLNVPKAKPDAPKTIGDAVPENIEFYPA